MSTSTKIAEINAKIEDTYTDLNSKFEKLNTHTKTLNKETMLFY